MAGESIEFKLFVRVDTFPRRPYVISYKAKTRDV
jgi:hypothetical protein